jgi:hypothetical protein
VIEDVEFEIEGGFGEEPPYSVKAFLTLTGDFVEECEGYINDVDADSLSFELGRNEAEKLLKQLGEGLRG